MGKLNLKRRRSRRPQVGDMRIRISIYQRDIQSPTFGSAKFSQKYTLIDTVWASPETTKGEGLFTGVELKTEVTDVFKIRYRDDVTSENVIKYNGNIFSILSVDDMDRRKTFLKIFCNVLGDEDLEANQ